MKKLSTISNSEISSESSDSDSESANAPVLDSSTPIFLAADTMRVWDHPRVRKMQEGGELVGFSSSTGSENNNTRIIHIDRSAIDLSLNSGGDTSSSTSDSNADSKSPSSTSTSPFLHAWTEFLSLSRATALVISNSFFGEVAAEVGDVPFVYYGEGCMEVDL